MSMCVGKSEWAICGGKNKWAVYGDKSEWAMCVGKSEWAICGGKSEWAMCSSEGEWAMCGGKSEWAMYGGKWNKTPSCKFCQRQLIKTVCICFIFFQCRVTSLHLVTCLFLCVLFSVFWWRHFVLKCWIVLCPGPVLFWWVQFLCSFALRFADQHVVAFLCLCLAAPSCYLYLIYLYIIYICLQPCQRQGGCEWQVGTWLQLSARRFLHLFRWQHIWWVVGSTTPVSYMFILQAWVIKICIIMQT